MNIELTKEEIEWLIYTIKVYMFESGDTLSTSSILIKLSSYIE